MEEDIDALRARLLGQMKSSSYPTERSAIRDRYTDTSYYIFKTSQTSYRGSFLSFGSRRSSVVSSYGNTPTVIRRSFSSSGMLEYSVEQMGAHKFNVLPSITTEEKETDYQEGRVGASLDIITMGKLDEEKEEEEEGKPTSEYNREKLKEGASPSQGEDILSSHQEEPVVEEDSYLGSKNRKIFHHYDMPPMRKPSLSRRQQEAREERSAGVVPNGSLPEKEGEEVGSDVHLQPKEDEDEWTLNLKKEPLGGESTQADVPAVVVRRSEPQTVNQEKLESSVSSVLPRISPTISRLEESSSAPQPKLFSSTEGGPSKEGDGEDGFSLPRTPETLQLERASSVNEKTTTANAFPRKSNNRFSLRDFPLRSPTPPKKSHRKTTKNVNKERESGWRGAVSSPCPKEHDPPVVTPYSVDVVTATNSSVLPPLIAAGNCNDGSVHSNEHTLLSLVESKQPRVSVQNLDETPLFIVEEEYDKPPSTVSPRIGIPSLVSDGKLSKGFIVVHPTSDSNSLGLAPLSGASPTLSNLKKKTPPATNPRTTTAHSSSTPSHFSGATNGPNKSFLPYPTNPSSSLHKLRDDRRRTTGSDAGVSSSHRKTASGSFLSMKRPSQVKLLRFTRSTEEGGLSPTFVSPTAIKSSSFLTNYQATKGQIRSFPLDTSYEKGLSLDFSGNFVNTNSSRLCSVM